MSIRNAAKAIIIDNGKVLLNQCHNEQTGDYFCLPGGGQNQYETMAEAVIRECLEETGYEVIPSRFAALLEVIYDTDDPKADANYTHKIYHIFECEVKNRTAHTPTEQDTNQLGCVWVAIDDLSRVNLHPPVLGKNIDCIIKSKIPIFLGSEHEAFDRQV